MDRAEDGELRSVGACRMFAGIRRGSLQVIAKLLRSARSTHLVRASEAVFVGWARSWDGTVN